MDLNSQAIHDVIHPTAIFSSHSEPDRPSIQDSVEAPQSYWEHDQLNPKNQIDSLGPLKSPLWRIDGCAGLGTQFFAVPLFLEDPPPVRFDVFISESAMDSPLIQKLLDIDTVFHARDRSRVQRQAISFYIVRALQAWTEKLGVDTVKDLYYEQPFGSRIIFADLSLNLHNVQISVVPMHNLETHQCSAQELATMWQMKHTEMPPTVDIFSLVFVQQLQDSVCLVRYRDGKSSGQRGSQKESWILKALTSSVKYMYHELRNLLTMPPHPNVMTRPVKLVTKRSRFNDKRSVVVGFLVPYYSGGGLRDELPLLRMNNRLKLDDQVRWARDICSGLVHIRQKAKIYYPDLRLDQIVLSSDDKRPVILDFEQRGVWCEFASPEVNALEHIRMLANEEDEEDDLDQEDGFVVITDPGDAAFHTKKHSRRRFADHLTRLMPDWKQLGGTDDYYENPPRGYNVAWICLSAREQEYAEVYMLGRLLWCIFEGMSAPQRGAAWQSYRNEPEFDFPEFRLTPPELRGLIDQCTRGRRDQLSNHIVRRGSKLVLRDDQRADGTAEEIREEARKFWHGEVDWAESFLLDREARMQEGTWDENIFGRPTLKEVYDVLLDFQPHTG